MRIDFGALRGASAAPLPRHSSVNASHNAMPLTRLLQSKESTRRKRGEASDEPLEETDGQSERWTSRRAVNQQQKN